MCLQRMRHSQQQNCHDYHIQVHEPLKSLNPTFSPISVRSPPGSSSRSGARAQACITSWNCLSSWGEPNRILSLRVAFCIQACCGTKAREPWKERQEESGKKFSLITLLSSPLPWKLYSYRFSFKPNTTAVGSGKKNQ